MKLDPKRYKRMLSEMRNDALRKDPDAYPKILASAYRIAPGWSSEEAGGGSHSMDNHSAFLADTAFVTKAKDPEKGGKMAGSRNHLFRLRSNWTLCSRLREEGRSGESAGSHCHSR
jgi:hypothetical protein